jgi:hypothetical protein
VAVGKSPGTDDGNGDGRAAIGVTAGPGCVIGRGAPGALPRGGSLVLAARRFGLADFAFGLVFALRAGFRAATFFLRAGAARFFALVAFFAFRFFAMIASGCVN